MTTAPRAGIGRRRALRAVAVAAAWMVMLRARADVGLSAGDRRLALLGAQLRVHDPRRARALARLIDGRVTGHAVRPSARARRARRRLLDPARIRQELVRGDVVVVDGWVLARSEVALCAYLDVLASRSDA